MKAEFDVKTAATLIVDRGFVEDGILPRYVGIIS